MQYGRADLWNVYYAFRMNPQSRIWNKLRRQRVPWHGNKSIAELHETMLGSLVTTRTPDPLTLERILVTAYFSAPSGRSNVTSLEAARTRRRR